MTASDARIWGNWVAVFCPKGPWLRTGMLASLDLRTGRELWCVPEVAVGDLSEDGGVLLVASPRTPLLGDGLPDGHQTLALLDLRTGRVRWKTDVPGYLGPPVIHQEFVFFYSAIEHLEGAVTRLRASDGALVPTLTAPGVPWSDPAFDGGHAYFGTPHWLYELDLPDLAVGRKYYDAAWRHPMSAGGYLVAGVWGGDLAYRLEPSGPHALWANPTGDEAPLAWLPTVSSGAILLGSKCLSLETGGLLWYERAQELPVMGALAAGAQVAMEDAGQPSWLRMPPVRYPHGVAQPPDHKQSSPRWERGWSPGRGYLVVRDAATGRVLWRSLRLAGRPLAASRGYLLVASGNRLWCLR